MAPDGTKNKNETALDPNVVRRMSYADTLNPTVEDQVHCGTEAILQSHHVREGPGRIANAPVPSVFVSQPSDYTITHSVLCLDGVIGVGVKYPRKWLPEFRNPQDIIDDIHGDRRGTLLSVLILTPLLDAIHPIETVGTEGRPFRSLELTRTMS